MTMFVLGALFSDIVVKAVLVTLLHSLWLGAVMALFAGVILSFTQKSAPGLRYILLTGLFTLFLAGTGYVFYNAINTQATVIYTGAVMADQAKTRPLTGLAQQQKDIIATLISFVKTHADIIVLIWFVVICFKYMQLISGLRVLNNLKKRNISEAGTFWNYRVNELAVSIGISKTVVLLQSSLAKIPMIIGHFKPVILFPVGLLNALPPGEVEAILLHELAHIRRNDFLINLLQRFAEIFFFFNPAVLWISSLIKNERENCCDDIAIDITHDRKKFIHALVAFQEYNSGSAYATAFPGSKNHLLNRVRRIITKNNITLNNMEKLILASGIIFTCLATAAFSSIDLKSKKQTNAGPLITISAAGVNSPSPAGSTAASKNDNPVSTRTISYKNTLFKKEAIPDTSTKTHFSGVIDGKKIELTEEGNQVKELYVDGKKIPEEQYDQYRNIIDKVHMEMAENTAQLKKNANLLKYEKEALDTQIEAMERAEKMLEQGILKEEEFAKREDDLMKQKRVEMKKQAELRSENREMAKLELLKAQAELLRRQGQLKSGKTEFQQKTEELKELQEKLEEMLKDTIKVNRVTKVKPTASVKPVITTSSAFPVSTSASVKPNIREKIAITATPAVSVKPVATVKPAAYIHRNPVNEEIISDLKEANIITSENNLSFRLTNDEFVVNGVKQPADIHQKILKKYGGKPGGTISMSYANHQ